MRKGFTLIELLAVIVILAIIALIATPIVLNIIDDSRQSSTLRSADFYLDAVEYTIANAVLYEGGIENGDYPIDNNGNPCMVALTNGTCPEDKTLTVEVNGEKPSSGTITIENGNIKDISINLNNKVVVKNDKGELKYKINPCQKVSGDKNTPGSEYECEVKPGVKYTFYVLSQETDGTTNLIMEGNICEDGTMATSENKCAVAWLSRDVANIIPYDEDNCYREEGCTSNDKGPITAMNHIYNATDDWENIPNIKMNYIDKGNDGSIEENGYGTIKTENNTTTITKMDETTITATYTNLKARIPTHSEITTLGCYDQTPPEYMTTCPEYVRTNLDGITGYMFIDSFSHGSMWGFYAYGSAFNVDVTDTDFGVRPVINVQL